MKRSAVGFCAIVIACTLACNGDNGAVTVTAASPVDYEDYLSWERWPELKVNTRTIMRSTFDRGGGNEGSDSSHYLRQNERGLVALDVAGKGTLEFVRANHWHGSPWQYTVDGNTTVVSETNTADPDHPVDNSTWIPGVAFPPALAPTFSTTQGADLSWVRIPFENQLEIAYGRSHYGTGYFILSLEPQDLANPSPPSSWNGATAPPPIVSDLFLAAGTDLTANQTLATATSTVTLAAGAPTTVLDITRAGTLRSLQFTVPLASAEAFGHAHLRIRWDDRDAFSVDSPIALFFGAGSLHNRDDKEWLVKAFPVSVHFPPGGANAELAVYFPMPFTSNAHLELESDIAISDIGVRARWQDSPERVPSGLFHATYRDHGIPVPGVDLELLDTNGVEGTPQWCGKIVGTSFIFSDDAVFGTLEGDPRFFFDDNQTPQIQGTGTEEWGGGGDYWGGQTMTLPFVGHPTGAPSPMAMTSAEDGIEGAYRFLLGDAMPFGRRALLQLEHGGMDESTEHYQSVAFWYGAPRACLAASDALHVGDPADEAAHGYVSVGGSDPYSVTSRYEVGVDHVGATEIVPTHTDFGRTVTGSSEFTVGIPSDNAGVLLRRTLDYATPDQRAEIWVRDGSAPDASFEHAATWLTAGSTTALYANANDETGATVTSPRPVDRRWKDDELLLAPRFSAGKTSLRIRVVVTPNGTSPTPGAPPNPAAWTEFWYRAYAWSQP